MKFASLTFAAIAVLSTAFLAVPSSVAANYTWGGHTFATEAEMHEYITEYWVVWRKLHGVSYTSSRSTAYSNTYTYTYERDKASFNVDVRRADDITAHEARLLGRISFKDSDLVKIWFDYGTSPYRLVNRTEYETLAENSFGSKYFDREVRALEHDTKYYFRAGGINEDGVTRYSDIESFRTDVDPRDETAEINVTTKRATNVDEDRATLQAKVVLEDSSYGYVWFEYGDEEDDLYKDTKKHAVYPDDDKLYTYSVRGLDDETYHYFRIVGVDADGNKNYGKVVKFKTKRDIKDEAPKLKINRAQDVGLHSATISGSVDMNDFRNATVFFVYGEDRDEIRDIEDEYSRYSRIKERGDDLQKVRVDSDLDRFDEYNIDISDIDLDTRHYYAIGIEYENEDDDDVIVLSSIKYFTTKDVR